MNIERRVFWLQIGFLILSLGYFLLLLMLYNNYKIDSLQTEALKNILQMIKLLGGF